MDINNAWRSLPPTGSQLQFITRISKAYSLKTIEPVNRGQAHEEIRRLKRAAADSIPFANKGLVGNIDDLLNKKGDT